LARHKELGNKLLGSIAHGSERGGRLLSEAGVEAAAPGPPAREGAMSEFQQFFARRWPDPGDRAGRAAEIMGRQCRDALDGLTALSDGLTALQAGLDTHVAAARAAQGFCERAQACYRPDGTVDEQMFRAIRDEWQRDRGPAGDR
jgi:hypothetical protein